MTAPRITVTLARQVRLDGTGDEPGGVGGLVPGAGGLEAPGFAPPARTQLDLSCSAAGIAGLITPPDAPARLGVAGLAAGPATVPLPFGARAVVAAADGGVWVLTGDGVLTVDPGGRVLAEFEVPADRLVGALATSGAVWALTSDAAWFISPDRTVVRHAAPWSNPVDVAATGDRLAGWDRDGADDMLVLAPDGTLERTPAPSAREPFERLLAYDGTTSLRASLRRLRRDGPGGGTLDVLGCGVGSDGGFLAARAGGEAWLWTSLPDPARLELAGGERVLAVSDDRVLVADRARARWINRSGGDVATDPITLDATSYDRDVRPYAWEMPAGYGTAACSTHRVVLTAAGPTGLVALAVDWA